MLKWFGENIPRFVAAFGWQAALTVIVVLFLLMVGAAWLFGFDLTMLGLGAK